jgi:hypothetical protein
MEQKHDYTSITTVDAAFTAAGIDLNSLGEMFANVPEQFRPGTIKDFKRTVVVSQINGAWVEDWGNTDQAKYFPWWDVETKASGGFGLSLFDVNYARTCARVGARRVFESREKARHYAEFFAEFEVECYSN